MRRQFVDFDPSTGDQAIKLSQSFNEIYLYTPVVENSELIIKILKSGVKNVKFVKTIEALLELEEVDLINVSENMPLSLIRPLRDKNPEAKVLIGDSILQREKSKKWIHTYRAAVSSRVRDKYPDAFKQLTELKTMIPMGDEERYLIDYEMSFVAYYIGEKRLGLESVSNILVSHFASWEMKNEILGIAQFYIDKLPILGEIEVKIPIEQPFIESSPSLVKVDGGFYLNIRAVNWIIDRETGEYKAQHPEGTILTRNFLVKLDESFNIIETVELIDRSETARYPYRVKGLEDIRLISNSEFFCTNLEIMPANRPQICYCNYREDGTVDKVVRLRVTDDCEKNWLPFKIDGVLHFIYSSDPLKIYKVVNDEPVLIFNKVLQAEFLDGFRGSACPIEYKGGFLYTIHQVMYSKPRKYYHRFVWVNRGFTFLKYGKLWVFENPDIEFNLSMCLHNDELLMTYSKWDNSAKLVRVPLSAIDI